MCSLLCQLCLLSFFVEDILDDVSGLTLESPDDTYEEEPCLPLQSHRDHQEDKTCIGTGYKVRYVLQSQILHTKPGKKFIHAKITGY